LLGQVVGCLELSWQALEAWWEAVSSVGLRGIKVLGFHLARRNLRVGSANEGLVLTLRAGLDTDSRVKDTSDIDGIELCQVEVLVLREAAFTTEVLVGVKRSNESADLAFVVGFISDVAEGSKESNEDAEARQVSAASVVFERASRQVLSLLFETLLFPLPSSQTVA